MIEDKEQPLPPAANTAGWPWRAVLLIAAVALSGMASEAVAQDLAAKMMADAYLAGADPKTATASPLFADLSGLPPVLVQVGTSEVLLPAEGNPFSTGEIWLTISASGFDVPFDYDLFPVDLVLRRQTQNSQDTWSLHAP